MGRPINPNYTGNITIANVQTIAMQAWIPGDLAPTSGYIIKQRTSNSYKSGNIYGPSSGLVTLVNGANATPLAQGQCNVTVSPWGSTGTGATATANLGINSANIQVAGTGSGPYTHWYIPGELLSLSGGTANVVANLSVDTVTLGAISIGGGSTPGYTVGDSFTWGYAGYTVPTVVTVATTSGNGTISGVTIATAGTVSNVGVTNLTPFSSSVQTNTWATGANFTLRWDISQISVTNHGDYSAAPANIVALTGSAHGTGASVNATWQVSSVHITGTGGTGYLGALVNFSSGKAAAIATVNSNGNVASASVTVPGSGYSNTAPTVSISTVRNTEWASAIMNRTVNTFQGNVYQWVATGTVPTNSSQAVLQTG
jgi:hypothetical protein